MEDLLFRRLNSIKSKVDVEVVLQDLFLLDEKQAHAYPPEERRSFLTTALQRRRFFASLEDCREMADLFVRLRDLYLLATVDDLNDLLRSYYLYQNEKEETGSE